MRLRILNVNYKPISSRIAERNVNFPMETLACPLNQQPAEHQRDLGPEIVINKNFQLLKNASPYGQFLMRLMRWILSE